VTALHDVVNRPAALPPRYQRRITAGTPAGGFDHEAAKWPLTREDMKSDHAGRMFRTSSQTLSEISAQERTRSPRQFRKGRV
jgi:hypothetical protein